MERASYELGYEDRHTMEGTREGGRKGTMRRCSGRRVSKLARWKAENVENILGSIKRRNRKLAMLEDTGSSETCLSSWKIYQLPLGSLRGLPSSNGSVVLEERIDTGGNGQSASSSVRP
jgi:hypothetical protein